MCPLGITVLKITVQVLRVCLLKRHPQSTAAGGGLGTRARLALVEPRSPALQLDSLPAKPPGKPKNTGVGSLSLLQWISLTQEVNQGLLQCRRFLYHLSCEGSPFYLISFHIYSNQMTEQRHALPPSLGSPFG